MPTIDQLAPATGVSDADELLISQNGASRKVTRGLLIAGLQAQIATARGTLLGNPGTGTDGPAQIAVGANLTLDGAELSATAAPYIVASLPVGTVPSPIDMVPVGQGGANTAVPYSQFMSGFGGVANIDISKSVVVPTGAQAAMRTADLAAAAALITGAAMTGPLALAADPTFPLQASTKQYVDAGVASALSKVGGVMTGPLTLVGNPTQPLQSATKAYVDGQAGALLQKSGGSLSGPLVLVEDPAQPLEAATRRYVDAGTASSAAALATEASVRAAGDGALALSVNSAQTSAQQAQASAGAAQTSASAALTNSAAAQTSAASALGAAITAQAMANAALPTSGGTMTGNLSVPSNYVYAGTDDFAAVRAQGRPSDGKAMLYINKVGSAASDPSLFSTYYYVNDADGTGAPRLVNNLQANVTTTPVSGVWLTHFGITSAAVGGNQGNNGHLANDLQAVRSQSTPIGSTTVHTSLSVSGSVVSVVNVANFNQTVITGGMNAGRLISLENAPPISTSTTANAAGGGLNPVLQVGSTAGLVAGMFCWGSNVAAYVVGTTASSITLSTGLLGPVPSGSTINCGWAMLVKVGANFYHLVATSGETGPGTLAFAESVSVTDAAAGRAVVSAQGGAPLWAFVAEVQDQTNLPSSAAGFNQIGELDMSGNGDDDGPEAFVYNPVVGANLPQGGRCFLSFVASKFSPTGSDFVMNAGLSFTTVPGATINSVIFANATFNNALLDARNAVASSSNANAIWLADGHRVALSTDGSAGIVYDQAAAAIVASGTVRFTAPPVLPGYTVATLPIAATAGAKAYASNGRKSAEAVGAGTGVEVFADSSGRWISILSGTVVQA